LPKSTPTKLSAFVVAAPGLEAVVAEEIAELGVAGEVVPGGVTLQASLTDVARLNLWSRTATRIVIRLGTVHARDFPRLRKGVAALPWSLYIPADARLELRVSQTKSRLYHTGAITDAVMLGIADAVGAQELAPKLGHDDDFTPDPEAARRFRVLCRGEADHFTFSVDSSGELLHRRGYRQQIAHAPLRETLAAAMLRWLNWTPTEPLLDPMCGSGTLPIEAALMSTHRPPGIERTFAWQRWPSAESAIASYAATVAESRAAIVTAPAAVSGSDESALAVAASRGNCARAGLADVITWSHLSASVARPGPTPGLVVVNPPYGQRVGDPRALDRLYTDLGRTLRSHFPGWRAGILVAHKPLLRCIGRPQRELTFSHGGSRVTLALFNP